MELPDVLKIQDNSSPYDSVLYTHKTQPVTFSQSQTRFEIPKAGIMSSTAIVEWSFLPNPATATNASEGGMFPLSVGSSSCIRRAVLSTQSGRVIMDNREFNLKQVCEKSFRDGDYNHFVAPYLDLSWTTYRYADPVLEPDFVGTLRSCGVPKSADGVEVIDGSVWSVPDIVKLAGVGSPVAINASTSAIQQTRVSLQELFPFLYNLQLPTIMMEQLYLDIYWETDENNNIFQPASGLVYTGGGLVQQVDCFLITDSIVYTDPAVMDAIVAKQEASGGLTFPFKDYAVQVISDVDTSARSTESFERELGASNYKLTDIKNIELIGLGGASSLNSLLGKYYSNGQQSRHLQLVLNDSNLYPDNNATQMENYTRTSEVYSHTKPYIPRPIYALSSTAANSGVSLATLMGFEEQASLAGLMNPVGIQLKDDMGKVFQNGNAPIRLFYKKDATTASQGTFDNSSLQYYFVGYMREFMVMPSGKVVVSERA